MTPEQQARQIREQAAECGMSVEEFAAAYNSLTPEQIKAAMLARDRETICGWMEPRPTSKEGSAERLRDLGRVQWWRGQFVPPHRSGEWCPVYLSLDALHRVEERLNDRQRQRYAELLLGVTSDRIRHRFDYADAAALWHATAEQKIRALANVIRESLPASGKEPQK